MDQDQNSLDETMKRVLPKYLTIECHPVPDKLMDHYRLSFGRSRYKDHNFKVNCEYMVAQNERIFNPNVIADRTEEAMNMLCHILSDNSEQIVYLRSNFWARLKFLIFKK